MDQVDHVRVALRQVQDPDLHQDLVSLNMIRDIVVEGEVVRFRLVLTTGACPVKQSLEDQCRSAALSVAGDCVVPRSRSAPKYLQGQSLAHVLPGVRHVIGIGSGKGGVGKSTVTVNLAVALAKAGARVGVLDADIYGPSIPMMMKLSGQPPVANKKMIPLQAYGGVSVISMGFLVDDRQAVVWRAPMVVGALKQFISDVDWGELDYLLVDLPPGTGDIQLTLAQTVPLAGAVVVSTPQAVALLDARRSIAMFNKVKVPVFGIIENMSEFVVPEMRACRADFRPRGCRAGSDCLGHTIPWGSAVGTRGASGS